MRFKVGEFAMYKTESIVLIKHYLKNADLYVVVDLDSTLEWYTQSDNLVELTPLLKELL